MFSHITKIIVLNSMILHSVFGCGFHTVHQRDCHSTNIADSQQNESGCACHAHTKTQKKSASACSHSQQVCETSNSQEENSDHPEVIHLSGPDRSKNQPCSCQASGQNCLFVQTVFKPILTDTFSFYSSELNSTLSDSSAAYSGIALAVQQHQSGWAVVPSDACALRQLWLI